MKTKYETLLKFCKTERQREYIDAYYDNGFNITQAAKALGIDRRAVGRGIQAVKEAAAEAGNNIEQAYAPSILFIDIETSPLIRAGWSLYDKYTPGGMTGVLEDSGVICYARKYKGDEEVTVTSLRTHTHEELIKELWQDLNKADWFIAHNGDKFDIKRINAEFLRMGLPPYSPVKLIDTLKILKHRFKLTSHRLDDVCQTLFGVGKLDTGGIELWLECKKGNADAYKKMEDYNIRDIELLELLYDTIKGWATNHPNYNMFSSPSAELRCTVCGSSNITHKPFTTAKTAVSEFEMHQCDDCGHWSRGRKNVRDTQQMKQVLTHAK